MKANNDVNTQMKEELGESLIPGASTSAALKFGLIPARMDKNFWRQVKRPTWYNEVDEKGRDLWQQKKMEILGEVNKIIRRQLKDQSRQQGFQNRSQNQTGNRFPEQLSNTRDKNFQNQQGHPNSPSKVNYGPLQDRFRKTN